MEKIKYLQALEESLVDKITKSTEYRNKEHKVKMQNLYEEAADLNWEKAASGKKLLDDFII